MSAVYCSYSGFVGSDHFVFDSKYMKNDGLISVNAVPVDRPAFEPNSLTVAESDSYSSVTSLLTVTTEGSSSDEGCAEDGKGFMLGIGHQRDSSRGMDY
jgi:hypothetical protein